MSNPLCELLELGQSVWLDDIRRDLVEDGGLRALIENDGVRGVTSNPSIFRKAIAESDLYDDAIDALLSEDPAVSTEELYESLVVEDIRGAADALRPVWDETAGADGFVSLEVSPHLARDAEATVDEARRLWRRVDRPNLMIKVPATAEGMPAVQALIADGINVNVTLIFSLAHYEAAAAAYLAGLGCVDDPSRVASVASLFVSRLDTQVDKRLEAIGTEAALALRGRVAVANARLVYERFRELFGSEFSPLASAGARVQRPLWASTGTKNPEYSDVKYVEELVAPDTVNTVPRATLAAFRDHGTAAPAFDGDASGAREIVGTAASLGIDVDAVTEELQEVGVQKFIEPFDDLLATLEERRRQLAGAAR